MLAAGCDHEAPETKPRSEDRSAEHRLWRSAFVLLASFVCFVVKLCAY